MSADRYVANLSLGSAVAPAAPEFLQWARTCGVPSPALELFARAWVTDAEAYLGTLRFMTAAEIVRTATDEPRWVESGFFVFGSCANGDMIALDLADARGGVWFMSHEELWGDESVEPRRFSIQVATDLADLVARAWDDTFPVDCNEARERDGG